MSALDEMRKLRSKDESTLTRLELAIVLLWNSPDGREYIAEEAAAELAAMRAQLATQADAIAIARFIVLNRHNFGEHDPDGVKKAALDRLAAALAKLGD
jgi:hypothetical protein